MRLSVSAKLVLSFLLVTILVLAATLLLARWSFERGFLDYVNALEQTRLQGLSQVLATRYQAGGNTWQSIGPETFGDLNRQSFPRGERPPHMSRLRDARHERGRPVGPDGRANYERQGPLGGPGARGPGARGSEGLHRPLRAGPQTPDQPPTTLVALNGEFITGIPFELSQTDYISVPVLFEGVQIAELRSAPIRRLITPQATEFAAEQLHRSLLIGGLSLLIAAIASVLLARAFLAPLRRTISSVRQLAGGDFTVRMNTSRDDEFGELMADVDRLGLTLEENRESRRRWLADISHELRTPVAILAGEIEAMRDGVRRLDQKGLESLDYETARLRSLIDDLYELSLSDIGGLRYEFEQLDLGSVAQIATQPLQMRAESLGFALSVDVQEGCRVRADRSRMQQLIANLLQNAMAYTDSPGQIQVKVFTADSGICLAVLDSAPGVDSAQGKGANEPLKLLFEPLYRLDESRARNGAGAGLGLAICRNVALAHGATIDAADSPLGGLCITVRFKS